LWENSDENISPEIVDPGLCSYTNKYKYPLHLAFLVIPGLGCLASHRLNCEAIAYLVLLKRLIFRFFQA
jgi:hypothetical protein